MVHIPLTPVMFQVRQFGKTWMNNSAILIIGCCIQTTQTLGPKTTIKPSLYYHALWLWAPWSWSQAATVRWWVSSLAHLPVGLGKTPRPQLLSVSSLYGLFITEQPLGWLDFSDSCLGPAASVLRQRTGAAFGIFQPGLASFAASVSPNSLCHKACPGSRGRDTITDVDALSSQWKITWYQAWQLSTVKERTGKSTELEWWLLYSVLCRKGPIASRGGQRATGEGVHFIRNYGHLLLCSKLSKFRA